MKREPLLLAVLGAIFVVELAIGVPALWADLAGVRSDVAGDGAAAAPARLIAAAPLETAVPHANQSRQAKMSVARPKPLAQLATTAPKIVSRETLQAVARPAQTLTGADSSPTSIPPLEQSESKPTPLAERAGTLAVIDDVAQSDATASFSYIGHWEHVRSIDDGRTAGTSSRSHRPGSSATLTFTGTHVRLFGVCGPSGGPAVIALDGLPAGRLITFYAVKKDTHMLVFESPRLHWGRHRLSVSVTPDPRSAKAHYVNIDGAEYN